MAYVRMTRTMPVVVATPVATGMPGPLGADDGTGAGPATGSGAGGTTTLATTVTSFAGAAVGGRRAEPLYWGIAYGSIAVGFVAGLGLYAVVSPPEYKAAAGFDAFAALYIVAQVLERLFEPVANFVRGTVAGDTTEAGGPSSGGGEPDGAAESLTRPQAVAALDQALATAATAPSPDSAAAAMADAATAKAAIDQIRANAALSIWGIQSGLAMILCGGIGLFLLRGIGAAGVPVFLDIFVTGVAIGGGSKALHDLIKSVQVTKESKQDPPEAGGAA